MNNYKDFEVKDWLEDFKFQRWVYHAESDLFFRNYIENNPLQASCMEQAREILLSVRGELHVISEAEVKSRVAEIMDALPEEKLNKGSWWTGNWLRVAAVLLLASGVAFMFYQRYGRLDISVFEEVANVEHAPVRNIRITNQTENIRFVNLPDGSSVILKPGARITYPEKFALAQREVSMSGEAFFEVVKNPAQPFVVFAGTMVTRVKGTSFSISAKEGADEVKLVVKTGLVEVTRAVPEDGVEEKAAQMLLLRPNEQVTFNEKDKSMKASTLQKPVLLDLPVEKQDLEFKRTPLSEVFALLEKNYGVPIRFDQQAIAECTLTARLGDEPVTEKLDMICSVVNASYVLRNGAIVVTSAGCE